MSLVPMVIEQTGRGERSFDIYSRLLNDRIVMLTDEVNDVTSSLVVSQLLYLEGQEEEPLYTSGTIEPGKAVRSISLSRALQSGSYSLKLHIMPYDRETEAPLNDAVVTAALIVQ